MAAVDQHEIEGRPGKPGQHLIRPADLERHLGIAAVLEILAAGLCLPDVLDDGNVLGRPLREQHGGDAASRLQRPASFCGERRRNELVAGSVRAKDPAGRPVVNLGRVGQDSFDVLLAPVHPLQARPGAVKRAGRRRAVRCCKRRESLSIALFRGGTSPICRPNSGADGATDVCALVVSGVATTLILINISPARSHIDSSHGG
jgi:hypothetical protein